MGTRDRIKVNVKTEHLQNTIKQQRFKKKATCEQQQYFKWKYGNGSGPKWVVYISLSMERLSYFTINRAVRIHFYWAHYTANELWSLVKANWKGDGISVSVCLTIGYISRTCRLMVFTVCHILGIHYTHRHTHTRLHFILLHSTPKEGCSERITRVIDYL